MKRFLVLAAVALAATAGIAFAHGEKPKHGGVVQSTKDHLSFELVSKDGKATLYVEDHGKPVATAGAHGKLTILNGGEKTEVALAPAGENTLAATGDAKLRKGAKAIATVTFADKKTANVRFSLK
ncbi:MAG TPA: hypothetical protein VEC06_10735 [Paucimonas sp.]|nr:hypothetical protein [Paucimonas sp.]